MNKLEGNKDDGFQNGKNKFKKTLKKGIPDFSYQSLIEAVDKTYNYIVLNEGFQFDKPVDFLDVVEYFDGTEWLPLKRLIVWS